MATVPEITSINSTFENITPLTVKFMMGDFRTESTFYPSKNLIAPICFFWTLIVYLPGWLWWPLMKFPFSVEHLLGVVFDLSLIFVGFYLTLRIYVDARDKLPGIFTRLRALPQQTPIYLPKSHVIWEIGTMILVGLLGLGLARVAFDGSSGSNEFAHKVGLCTAFVTGLIMGDWAYFFSRIFLIMAVLVKEEKYNLNPIVPGKTVALRDLFRVAARITTINMLLLTCPLIIGLLYILQTAASLDLIIICYIVILIIIWGILFMPFIHALNAIIAVARKMRDQTLTELQTIIEQRYDGLKNLTEKDSSPLFIEIKNFIDLMGTVENSLLLPINLSGIGRLLVTLVIPLLPILITRLFPGP